MILNTHSNINFKKLYYKSTPVDKADAMCRSISTILEYDKLIHENTDVPEEVSAKEDEEASDKEGIPAYIGIEIPYIYSDVESLIKLRKSSGVEEEVKEKTPEQENNPGRLYGTGSLLDIKA